MAGRATVSTIWRTARTRGAAGPVVASLLVHTVLLAGLVRVSIGPTRADKLTDAPGDGSDATTVLNLSPEIVTPPPPAPPIAPIEPAVTQAPPEPQAPEAPTLPEPAVVAFKPPPDALIESRPTPPQPVRAILPAASPTSISARPASAPAPAAPEVAHVPQPGPVSFAGVQGARAARVIYVVDASGPMTSSLPFVKAELARSIARLAPTQSFQVVVVKQPVGTSEAGGVQTFAGGESLVPANDENKSRLGAWLTTIEPGGGSDLRPGFRAAFAMKPDLVFLLSRRIRRTGDAGAARATMNATLGDLESLNTRDPRTGQRPTVVKSLQFIDDDPTGLMPAIARLHGDGADSYRVVEPSAVR